MKELEKMLEELYYLATEKKHEGAIKRFATAIQVMKYLGYTYKETNGQIKVIKILN